MKPLVTVLLLIFSSSAFAKVSQLMCTSNAKDKSVRSFTLSGIDTDKPTVSIYDAPFEEKNEDRALVDLSFSSECESSYRLVFSSYSLADIKAGKVKSIKGLFIYDNPVLSEMVNGDESSAVSESVLVTCALKK